MIFKSLKHVKKRISYLFHPIIGEIWCLHRVLPNRSIFNSNKELEITPDFLEDLIIKYKNKKFQFVSIDEVEKKINNIGRNKMVNISFDDGFKDIFQFAYPIFKKYNVPFTIYLTTDFPDKKIFLWWMILEEIVLKNDNLDLSDGTTYNCATKEEKQAVFEIILSNIYSSGINMPIYFKQIFSNYLDEYTDDFSSNLTLNWEEVNEMLDSGLCTIGSHSVSHYDLTKLNIDEMEFELCNSKKIIEEKTGKTISHFSYPHSFYNDEIKEFIKKSSYKTAALGYGGKVRCGDDKYLLKRVYVTEP